jgi:hypothetical protein
MICFRIVARVGCKRCLVTGIPDEWSPALLKVCTEPGLQTVWPKYPIGKAAHSAPVWCSFLALFLTLFPALFLALFGRVMAGFLARKGGENPLHPGQNTLTPI